MRKQFDKAAAEAFANVTPLESACYHYLNDGFVPNAKATIHQFFTANPPKDCKPKYLQKVIATALDELTYPIENPKDNYAWSGRQRNAYAGLSQSTWRDNQLCKPTEQIIDTIRANADRVSSTINHQLYFS